MLEQRLLVVVDPDFIIAFRNNFIRKSVKFSLSMMAKRVRDR